MSLDLDHPAIARTHPYLRVLLGAAAERALKLHSDEVVIEHLLDACMRDEECAAHQLVSHAFADPETVSFELVALCPGIMVVGSKAALPFSTLSVQALHAARAVAVEARSDAVETAVLLAAAYAVLPQELRADLRLDPTELGPIPGDGNLAPDGPLFRGFSTDAKGVLSQANRGAHARGEDAIGPAQILLACLASDRELAGTCGLSAVAARERLAGRTSDPTPPPARLLPPCEDLLELLRSLPEGAGSLELLDACRAGVSQELSALFDRHRISASLLEKAVGAFRDPAFG